MKIWIYLLTFLVIEGAIAQDQHIVDSLELMAKNKRGVDRHAALYELAFQYIDKDNEQALEIICNAASMAWLSGDSLRIVKSLRVKGQVLYKLERAEEAIIDLESAFRMANLNRFMRESQMIANTLGTIHLQQDRYDLALQYYFIALQLARNGNDLEYIVYGLNNIGTTYYKLTDYQKALDYFLLSLEARVGREFGAFSVLVNISLCYVQLSEFEEAMIYLQRTVDECGNTCSEEHMMHIKLTSGLIHYGLNNYALAENDFLSSLAYAKVERDSRIMADNIYFLSDIYLQRNEISKAEGYLIEGMKLVDSGTPFPDAFLQTYKRFSELHFRVKNFKKAAEYQRKYILLKDSIYNRKLTLGLMAKEAEFAERQNRAKMEAQDELIKLNLVNIRRQRNLNIAAGLLVTMAVTLLVVLLRNYERKETINTLLEETVNQRTRQLEESRKTLLDEVRRQELNNQRTLNMMRKKVRTLKALTLLAKTEFFDPVVLKYIENIDKISGQIDERLDTL